MFRVEIYKERGEWEHCELEDSFKGMSFFVQTNKNQEEMVEDMEGIFPGCAVRCEGGILMEEIYGGVNKLCETMYQIYTDLIDEMSKLDKGIKTDVRQQYEKRISDIYDNLDMRFRFLLEINNLRRKIAKEILETKIRK